MKVSTEQLSQLIEDKFGFMHYENSPVDLSKPGAKEARATIKQYHTYLNSPNILPEQWARPSAGHFFLVSYVNTIIGLFISKNYEVIPLFIRRAFKFLQEVPQSPVSEHYRILVRQYLYQMACFLQTYTSTSQDSNELASNISKEEQTDGGELS